jgi:hypothetical protein
MKKLILSATLAFAGFAAVQASELKQPNTNRTEIVSVQDSVIKTPIQLDSLPAPIKTALQVDPYKAWTPTAAFHVKESATKEYFLIEVKKEQEIASLKFDKDGKPVQ